MKITFRPLSFIFTLLLIVPFISFSQPFIDPLNVKCQYFPRETYSKGEKNSMSTNLMEANILLPLELKNKDIILLNADVTKMKFISQGIETSSTTLYSTSFAFGYDHQWKKEKWRTMLMVIPKINSDYKNISSEDFQLGGVVLANYKKNDHLKYHFGVYYNREFFGDYFIPLIGIEWKINESTNLFGDLPANMNLEHRLNKKLYAGAAYQSTISSFRLSNGDYVREGDKLLGHNQVKIYFNYYLATHFVLYAEAGQTFYRMYNQYDKTNNEIGENSVFHKTNDGIFYTAGLAYRIRLD